MFVFKTVYITLLLIVISSAHSKLPTLDYYKGIQSELDEGMTPREALAAVISKHATLSYKMARRYLFGQIHLRQSTNGSYELTDVYCQNTYDKSDGIGPHEIPNHTVINCEHTWPQSRFSSHHSKNTQKTDMHHLYPVDSRSNSSRGNITFAEVNGRDVHEKCSASQRGSDVNSGTTSFEPPPSHRGNVARALFYFSVRYNISIPDQEEVHLRNWHIDDPADAFEMSRNDQIHALQGNRNPFIDEPDTVDEILNF
jgi:endonuclease I